MIQALTSAHFDDVIALGNKVHGEGYLDLNSLKYLNVKGIKDDINANFVAHINGELVGLD